MQDRNKPIQETAKKVALNNIIFIYIQPSLECQLKVIFFLLHTFLIIWENSENMNYFISPHAYFLIMVVL